ncbi:hypothetical protein [Streptomyces microflavus]|uniref:hypothetical protein n=1 Tax=Streptomyces microflavus TaxID=1919 RepID=UPI0034220486
MKSTRTLKAVRSLRSYRARNVRAAAEPDERARLFLDHHREPAAAHDGDGTNQRPAGTGIAARRCSACAADR